MDGHLLRRSRLARAAAQRLIRSSRQLQARHRVWLRRTVETDDGLVLAIARNRENRAKIEAGRRSTAEEPRT